MKTIICPTTRLISVSRVPGPSHDPQRISNPLEIALQPGQDDFILERNCTAEKFPLYHGVEYMPESLVERDKTKRENVRYIDRRLLEIFFE